jgi:cytochrome c biogenesis protein CcdA
VGILVVGAASNTTEGVASLVLFAAGTAVSMAVVSTAFGYALTQRPVAQRVSSVVPLLALASLAFGAWYALGAMRGPVTGL